MFSRATLEGKRPKLPLHIRTQQAQERGAFFGKIKQEPTSGETLDNDTNYNRPSSHKKSNGSRIALRLLKADWPVDGKEFHSEQTFHPAKIYFYLFTLSSNQTLFIHHRCFLDQTGKLRRWNICQGLCSVVFVAYAGCLPTCYLGTSCSGLCVSVYLLSKINTPLQVPASM